MTKILAGFSRLAIGGFLCLVAAACSGSPTGSGQPQATLSTPPRPTLSPAPSPTPRPVVTGTVPGQDSPQAVVAAFIDASAGVDIATECTLVLPAEQPNCIQLLTLANPGANGSITIGDIALSGTKAIVVAVGRLCANYNCVVNINRRNGLPASPADFDAAYQHVLNELGMGYPAYAASQVNGRWYVDVGPD